MQDEVRDKSVALVIDVGKKGGRLTADLLKWAIRRYQEQSRNPKVHHGKQTVKQLVKQGAGVQNIEITDKNIKSFERVARKYGVDFALKKDPQRANTTFSSSRRIKTRWKPPFPSMRQKRFSEARISPLLPPSLNTSRRS